jgi:hypothetical protein
MESVPNLFALAWIATPLSAVICFWLWLRYCRHVYDQAVAHEQKPDPQKMIKAASRGPFRRRLGKRLPLPRKPDNKAPAN